MPMVSTVHIILIAINILAFALYGIDKLKAKRHSWRIPESILLLAAAAFGSAGALAGMLFFRHKTKHPKFMICVPLFLLLQIILYRFLTRYYAP